MALINVYCETCRECIAIVDTDELIFPAVGSMFKSPDEKHGIAPPFEQSPWAGWEMMFCPHGRMHRISDAPDYVITEGRAKYQIPRYQEVVDRGHKEKGKEECWRQEKEIEDATNRLISDAGGGAIRALFNEELNKPDPAPTMHNDFLCRICGKQFKTKFGLTGHMRSHKPGELK